jgi:hypothetical protein
LYIVQTQSGAAKLPVTGNGSGSGTTAQVQQMPATGAAAYEPDIPAVNPRAATIRIYWNIRYGNSVMPVEIADVASFRFTADHSIVFTLSNGNTIELTDYKDLEFTIEPTAPVTSSKWDLEKTFKFGGAAYGVDNTLPSGQWYTPEHVTVFTPHEIIIYDASHEVERKYPIKFIPDYKARVSMFCFDGKLSPAYNYPETLVNGLVAIKFCSIDNGVLIGSTAALNDAGGTNVIDTRFSIDENDNLKVLFKDGEYIFK